MDPISQRRAPRWLSAAVGLVAVVIGALLVTRPFASLAVLVLLVAAGFVVSGIGELADRRRQADPRLGMIAGVAWIVGGLAVLVWPEVTVQVLAALVGIALIVGGLTRAIPAVRGDRDGRAAGLLLGGASIVLGIVVLGWPDITLLVVAVVFGIRVVLFGLARLFDSVRPPDEQVAHVAPTTTPTWRRWLRTVAAAVALVLALGVAGVSASLHRGEPMPDAFYDPPAEIPTTPGALIRAEPFDRALPAGARAFRILYTTTRDDATPALASGLVVVPAGAGDAPLPVIAWAHGTTGVAPGCAPSVLPDPFSAGAAPGLDDVIANGWAIVATDYIGLGADPPHAYLVGQQAGRSVLDAIRAARQLEGVALEDRAVVWGHSQGGGAALWTGVLAPTYAPDANVIGVAALSPASNLAGLASNLDVITGGEIFGAYIIQGYSDAYPDVAFGDYVRPTAQLQVREIAARCLAEPSVFVSIVQTLVFDRSIWAQPPGEGPLGRRLTENIPSGPIPAPLLVAQGLEDPLVLPAAQDAYVAERCAAGGQVDYRRYEGLEHVDIVEDGSPLIPDLLAWTRARLAGEPAMSTC